MILEVFTRIFVDADDFESTVTFYESLMHSAITKSFKTEGLSLAAISSPVMSVLVIAGSPEARAKFEETRITIRVDDVQTYTHRLAAATQLEEIQDTPIGHKMRYQHPDGTVVEYVDWKK